MQTKTYEYSTYTFIFGSHALCTLHVCLLSCTKVGHIYIYILQEMKYMQFCLFICLFVFIYFVIVVLVDFLTA